MNRNSGNRRATIALSAVLMLLPTSGAMGQEDAVEDRGLMMLLDQMAQEWVNGDDPVAMAALFASDADAGSLEKGWMFRGRQELEDMWRGGFEAHSAFPRAFRIRGIRILGPGIAVADVALERSEGTDQYGQVTGPIHDRLTLVLTQERKKWLIAAARSGGWRPMTEPN